MWELGLPPGSGGWGGGGIEGPSPCDRASPPHFPLVLVLPSLLGSGPHLMLHPRCRCSGVGVALLVFLTVFAISPTGTARGHVSFFFPLIVSFAVPGNMPGPATFMEVVVSYGLPLSTDLCHFAVQLYGRRDGMCDP